MTFDKLLRAHYLDEGWHRIYKKYGGKVLARENYRWKRKVMKRFGPNRKAILWANICETNHFLARLKKK